MNDTRRRKLVKAIELLEEAKSIIECIKDEEQDAFDSLPESFQESERGWDMEEVIYNLENNFDAVQDVIDEIFDNCDLNRVCK